jgi:hypothetical protein
VKEAHSKLSAMRRRLKLKGMADETGVHKEVAKEEHMKHAPIIEENVQVPTANVEEAEPGKEVLKVKNQVL